jgi:hypothetical protein
MSRVRATALSALLALGCDPGDDIVARLTGAPEAGAGADCCAPGVRTPMADTAPLPDVCAARPARIVLLSKAGVLYELHPEQGVALELGAPSCLKPGAFVAAIDLDDRVWVVPDDGLMRVIEPQTLKCEELPLALKPSAMAFVYDPSFKRQLLYAIVAGTLIVFNPDTKVRSPIGELSQEVQFLGGGVQGELLAFRQSGDAVLMGRVAPESANVNFLSKAMAPLGLPLQGAAAWSSDLLFIFQRDLYRLRSGSVELSPSMTKLLSEDPGFLAVGASPCATLAK